MPLGHRDQPVQALPPYYSYHAQPQIEFAFERRGGDFSTRSAMYNSGADVLPSFLGSQDSSSGLLLFMVEKTTRG